MEQNTQNRMSGCELINCFCLTDKLSAIYQLGVEEWGIQVISVGTHDKLSLNIMN